MTTQPTPETYTLYLVYTGHYKEGYRYCVADDNKEYLTNTILVFSKTLYKASPGAVIEAQAIQENGRTVIIGKSKYAGFWHDKSRVLQWESHDRAEDLEKRTSKIAATSQLKEALFPIHRIYLSSDRRKRAALIAMVIDLITNG